LVLIVYFADIFIFGNNFPNKPDEMRVVVVDDEFFSRQTITDLLSESFKDIEVVGQADSVKTAVELLPSLKPDLVFLDVDLTDGTGFDILNLLKPIQFKIIFITAHQEYAMKAIKFSAFDYILKPVSESELKMDAFFYNAENIRKEGKKIVLKTSESIHLVSVCDIMRCEADNNYTTFYLATGERIVISHGLKEYEDLLGNYGFFRVHQSHLINLKFIARFDKKDGGYVILTDKSQIPVSQRKKQKLLEVIEGLT